MSERRFAYKVVGVCREKPDTFRSMWADRELLKFYTPNKTTCADTDVLKKGFGLFVFLDEEKAMVYAEKTHVVWKVEIGTIMPLPEKILVGARYKSEYEHESEFREAYVSENFNDWFMTDKVTLIEKVYDWRDK